MKKNSRKMKKSVDNIGLTDYYKDTEMKSV